MTIFLSRDIDDNFGFDSDILDRKYLYDNIISIIKGEPSGVSIAISSDWGEGKTTFIKMMINSLNKINLNSIYINSLDFDCTEDPFGVLAINLTNNMYKNNYFKAKSFLTKAIDCSKGVLAGGARAAIKAATCGMIDAEEISGIINEELLDKDVLKKDSQFDMSKNKIEYTASLKSSLEEYARDIFEKTGYPLIIVVDELDRCRPNIAIKSLEILSHVFNCKYTCIIYAINKIQIYESIKSEYGINVKPDFYLQKFFNLEIDIPSSENNSTPDSVKFIESFSSQLRVMHDDDFSSNAIKAMSLNCKVFKLSLRQCERAMTIFLLLHKLAPNGFYYYFASFVACAKVKNCNSLKNVVDKSITVDALLRRLDLNLASYGVREIKALSNCIGTIESILNNNDQDSLLPDEIRHSSEYVINEERFLKYIKSIEFIR